MNASRVTLDTNILIYAIDRDAGKKHERAIDVIAQALKMDSFLTLQVLCEFYAATTRKRYAQHKDVVMFIKEWANVFPIVERNYTALSTALEAVEKHSLSFWDAMLWATTKEAQGTLLLSEDFQHDVVLGGVKIVNPFLTDKKLTHL